MTGAGSVKAVRSRGVYRKVYVAIEARRPISAVYHDLPLLFWAHRLGRNTVGQFRVLCYQSGDKSKSGLEPPGSPANWRCIALEKLSAVELLDGAWRTAPNHSRPASCIVDPDIDADDYPEREPQHGQ